MGASNVSDLGSVVRVHERLDDLTRAMNDLNVSIAELRGSTKYHTDNMEIIKEEFAKRDIRAQVIREWGESEVKRLDRTQQQHHLEMERDRAFVQGAWRVLAVLGTVLLAAMGYLGFTVRDVANLAVNLPTRLEALEAQMAFTQKLIVAPKANREDMR